MNKKIYERYLSMIPNKMKWLILILGIVLFLGLIGYLMIIYGGKLVIDDEKLILNSTTTIETSDGNTIGELYFENRYLITLDQVPEHVQNAFIAIEDVRFYQHAGVDIKSVARAVYRDVISFGKVEGASTITQQLAKNLFLYNDKTWMRKTKEVMAAIYLERTYSKDEILELYLNAIYFGHGIYGIETAAQYFFSKSVEELTVAEGALMAALAKAPNGYSPINHPDKALTRRNVALKAMNNAEMISTDMMLTEQGKTLGLNVKEKEVDPWVNSYLDLVMKEAAKKHSISIDELKRGGYRIVVNIDKQAQKIAYEEFKKDRYFPGNTDGVEGAFVMLEEATGQVKVALGGRDYQLGDLNRVTVKRQPGSTFKPLAVYGPAMMTEEYEPYSLLKDEELAYGDYVARNYDDQYEGEISLYEALVKSKNTSTVWLLDQIGIDYSKDYLKKMNIDIPDEGLAIGLGGLSEGVTP
ncbi:MAG TPA: transglycosylase domain-containing protein, partial [Candidatus Dormibacteraeota bacterium]|nr:transglycosylase domain-containing protein [Candidatus Dormibacteraeota bacterium]